MATTPTTSPAKAVFGFGFPTTTPKPGITTAAQTSTPQTMGNAAKSPEALLKPPPKTIAPAQVSHTQPVIQAPQSSTPPTVNPNMQFQTNTGNAPQGTPAPQQPAQQPTQPAVNPQSYSGLMGSLINKGTQESPGVAKARQDLQDVLNAEAATKQAIGQQPIDYTFQQGRQGLAQQYYAQKEAAAQTGVQNALTANQQQIGALGTAIGTVPDALRYGGSGGQFDPNTKASEYAQDVLSGKRTYNDAVAAMGLYGSVGKQFLDQTIQKGNPQFNFAQAQTLSSIQGTVGPAVQYASSSLDNLSSALGQTQVPGQGSNIPFLNTGANILSDVSGFGGKQTQALRSAVAEARAALTNVFIQKGVTPTAAGDQANALIPDNPTPQQVAAAKQTLATFGQQTQDIYSNPGQAGLGGGQNSGPAQSVVQTSAGPVNTNW